MHKYLRAIGFSKYNKKRELRPLLDLVIQSSTASSLITEGDEVYGHISRAFGDRFGLRLYAAVLNQLYLLALELDYAVAHQRQAGVYAKYYHLAPSPQNILPIMIPLKSP